jgi:hypothetical protein
MYGNITLNPLICIIYILIENKIKNKKVNPSQFLVVSNPRGRG